MDTSQKRCMNSQLSQEKFLHIISDQGLQLKSQWNITMYTLEWLTLKILKTSKVGEHAVQLNPYIAEGIGKWYNHFGKLFGTSW